MGRSALKEANKIAKLEREVKSSNLIIGIHKMALEKAAQEIKRLGGDEELYLHLSKLANIGGAIERELEKVKAN